MRTGVRRTLWGVGVLVLVLGAGFGVLVLALRHPFPEGREGPEAEAFARRIEEFCGGPRDAAGRNAWDRTGAVRWTFRGKNRHLWDRRRQLARVRFGEVEVLLDLPRRKGRAFRAGAEVAGAERDALVDRAYALWINDSFWLSAPTKLFDTGTARSSVVLEDGRKGVLVTYRSGGLTPGDRYLWLAGEDGKPTAWRMWVSILPVGGLEFTITEWTELATGARVASRHVLLGPLAITLTEVAGAESLAALEPGADPFARLLR